MRILILFSTAVLLLSGCTKVVDAVVSAAGTANPVPKNTFVSYTIPQGEHYCDQSTYTAIRTDALNFVVRFDSTAVYRTSNNENQNDINKLYGFSDNGAQHHQYSARFGWRWSNGALRLFAYTYNGGKVASKEIGTVAIGTDVACSITVLSDAYLFQMNGQKVSMPRQSTTPLAEGYLLYPYFGGDETAPHPVSIQIKQL